jgi:hypothetical protein
MSVKIPRYDQPALQVRDLIQILQGCDPNALIVMFTEVDSSPLFRSDIDKRGSDSIVKLNGETFEGPILGIWNSDF